MPPLASVPQMASMTSTPFTPNHGPTFRMTRFASSFERGMGPKSMTIELAADASAPSLASFAHSA